MNTLEDTREEFKTNYKSLVMSKTGQWTDEDIKKLEEECKKIEKNSAILATIIMCVVYLGIIILAGILLNMAGIF